MIRPVQRADAAAIAALYNPYIRDTVITFEEEPVDAEVMAGRIDAVIPSLPWLVWEEQRQILGYAYATRFRERAAYRHSVESTIYLHPRAMGRGVGRQLYVALLDRLRELPLHVVMGVIALPNEPSVALHERLGFVRAALFPEVGRKFERWVDVGYWQLTL